MLQIKSHQKPQILKENFRNSIIMRSQNKLNSNYSKFEVQIKT